MKSISFFIALTMSFFLVNNSFAQISSQPPLKAGGDTIWSTTFNWEDPSSPRGWTLPEGWEIGEVTDFGFNWIWQKDTLRFNNDKSFMAPPSHFKTAKDGFLLMPIQAYNMADGIFTGNDVDAYIITEPIDCSGAPSVVVNLSHAFRFCCGQIALDMAVSNDQGVHWATYDLTFGAPNNSITPPKYKSVIINISDVAAGMNDVRIKFQMKNAENYYWFIDDLVLTQAYNVDLSLQDFWAEMNGGFNESVGHINYLPKNQIGSASPISGTIGEYNFTGAVQNVGVQDVENAFLKIQVLKNGEEVSTLNSEKVDIWTLDRDTLSPEAPFLPVAHGDYLVNFDAVTDGELLAANNQASYGFTVNDTLYLRSDRTAEDAANSGGYGGSNQAGDMVGMKYDIYNSTEINSMTAYISSFTAAESPEFQYVLLKFIPDDGTYVEWLSSEIVYMDSTMIRTWVTLEISKDGETEFLDPGQYIACVRMWGNNGTATGTQGMTIGRDLTTKSKLEYTYIFLMSSQAEFSTDKLLLIGLNLNEAGGPTKAPVTFNVDMKKHIANGEFIPGTDKVDVAGSFNAWAGSDFLNDADGDGIYSITVNDLLIGGIIEYKYRINANWDTSEFPLGGPNRKYQVKYWNILNNVYNNGLTNGIPNYQIDASIKIYPNPNTGVFLLNLSSDKMQPYHISICNTLGVIVYTKQIPSCLTGMEEINLDLPAGLYFLNISNESGRKTEKLMIR
jgi:hypothetical protein